MSKKALLTFTFAALVGVISAQSLRFGYYDGWNEFHAYNNNEVVICETEPNEIGEIAFEAALQNLTSDPIDVIVEKEHIFIVDGTENSFCWGLCYSPATNVSNPRTLDGNAVSILHELSFHHQIDPTYSGDPSQYIAGTSIVKYYAYPADNTSDRVCLEMHFKYDPSNVTENPVRLGHAYPNPASSMVYFDLNVDSDVVVSVYNLLGQEVKTQRVGRDQNRVSIAVDDFQPGVYFCSFQINSETVSTEKFIVKR